MITMDTKIGDTVTNWYGETKIVVGESSEGKWWLLRSVVTGRITPAHKVTADTVVIVGQPIGGN
jgi:hypothetical protein